jgi:hypothetical protein
MYRLGFGLLKLHETVISLAAADVQAKYDGGYPSRLKKQPSKITLWFVFAGLFAEHSFSKPDETETFHLPFLSPISREIYSLPSFYVQCMRGIARNTTETVKQAHLTSSYARRQTTISILFCELWSNKITAILRRGPIPVWT